MNQLKPSPSEAATDTAPSSRHNHDEVTRTTWSRFDPAPRLRGVARSLTTNAAVAVMAVALAACGTNGALDNGPHRGQDDSNKAQQRDRERADVQIPAPPPELVGTWHNDPSGTDWYLTITVEGAYTLTNADLGVHDEGYVDASPGQLQLVSASGDNRAAAVVVDPPGCDWEVSSSQLYGISFVQVQFCNRGAWVRA